MKQAEYDRANTQKIAAFGGIYGNIRKTALSVRLGIVLN